MSITKIPERITKTCDVCGKSTDTGAHFKQSGHLKLRRDALDWGGVPCADASAEFDVCDSCLGPIAEAINEVAKLRRAAGIGTTATKEQSNG